MSLTGKTAVVTGGSRGIGRAISIELAAQGANIVLCYAGNEVCAADTESACRALGARTMVIRCDVTDAAAVKAMMKDVIRTFGRIDILVNNAGITRDAFLLMMREADYDAVIDTNLKGAFLCIKAAVHAMMKQQYGRIINLSSVVGMHGNAGQANYAASKAGLIGLTKSAAKELVFKGITVNCIAPGYIATDMTASFAEEAQQKLLAAIPAARMGLPEEVAKAAAFLASDDAAYITGQVLCVDGGMGM